jgi:hypothetical protein
MQKTYKYCINNNINEIFSNEPFIFVSQKFDCYCVEDFTPLKIKF